MRSVSVQNFSIRASLQQDDYFRAGFILFCLVSAVVLLKLSFHPSIQQFFFDRTSDYIQAQESGNALMQTLGNQFIAWLFVVSLGIMSFSSFRKKFLLAGILFLSESSFFVLSVIQYLFGFRAGGCDVCGNAWFISWAQIAVWLLTIPVIFLLCFSSLFVYEKQSIYFKAILISASVTGILALLGFWFFLNSIT